MRLYCPRSGPDKEKISYCEACAKVKLLSPLKHRIYLDENGKITNPASDANKFRQCWTCGLIVGVYEAKQEVELDTLTEPRENPFKFKSGLVETGESRKIDRTGKTQHKRKFKEDLEQYKEQDIKDALKKGSKLVSYVERQD
ncbi:MAG: hypothetical protein ACHQXG_00950 [Nitrososphaerales archaeon]